MPEQVNFNYLICCMITKKDIPFTLFKIIEFVAQANLDIIKLNKEDHLYYGFAETDNNSKNYFKIFIDGGKILSGNYNSLKYTVDIKPRDQTSIAGGYQQLTLEELETKFLDWVKLIRDIHESPSVYDDNFTKQYSDFYFNEFKIVDMDANVFHLTLINKN